MTQQLGAALPRLRATPAFTTAALASLGVALGLNILIFCFTSPVLFRAMPYPEPDRLLDVSMAPPGKPESKGVMTPALYLLLRDRTDAAFSAVGAVDSGRSANLAGDTHGPAERLDGHRISATGLAALGASPLIGRLPTAADEQTGAAPTIVLSYPVWQRRFGGRPEVVGQAVQVDGQPTQIIGVMPAGFGLLDNSSDAWFPFSFDPPPGQEFQHNLRVIGRVKPGVSMTDAKAAATVALDAYVQQYPSRDKDWTVELTPWREARFGGMRRPLTMVQVGVGVILLLVCVSVSVLMRARTVVIRPSAAALESTSISPGRVLTQSLLLALGGGALGAALAAAVLPTLRDLTPTALPRVSEVRFDAAVVVFTALLIVAVTLAVGLLPARRASRPQTTTKGWAGAGALVILVAVQMALAFVLMAATGLTMRAIGDLRSRDVGINPAGLLSADVYLPRDPYVTRGISGSGAAEIAAFNPAGAAVYDRIRAALQTMPGVVQAAGVGTHPFAANPFVQLWTGDLEHTPDSQIAAQYLAVTENYFTTMGVRLVRGRDFSADDRADSPWVVLVNETLAKQQWPGGDPIGQKLTLTFSPNDEEPAREIIGMVADTIPFRGASEVPPLIYVLHRQQAAEQRASLEGRRTVMSFILRTSSGDPLALADAVRAQVGKVEPTTPVASIRTVASYLDAGQTVLFQYGETLLGIFALVALVAGAVSVYALTAYGAAHHQSIVAVGLFVVAAVVAGAAAGWTVWMRLASVIASFLTNLTVTPSDSKPLIVTGGVILLTALVVFLAGARRPPPAAPETRLV
ncbi:MAG: ABC transporter permease [Vicinamibacterales bacterium]